MEGRLKTEDCADGEGGLKCSFSKTSASSAGTTDPVIPLQSCQVWGLGPGPLSPCIKKSRDRLSLERALPLAKRSTAESSFLKGVKPENYK